MVLTVTDLVERIEPLRARGEPVHYINERNEGLIRINSIASPQGPIRVLRWNPAKAQSEAAASDASISRGMLRRVAAAIEPGVPFSVDRVLGASYNVRSVLESLLANTAEFYICRPGRIEIDAGSARILAGHKHLIYRPGQPHEVGETREIDTNAVVYESPGSFHMYEALLPETGYRVRSRVTKLRLDSLIAHNLSIVGSRIGVQVHCRPEYEDLRFGGRPLADLDGYIRDLESVPLLAGFPEARRIAAEVDSLWFWGKGLVGAWQICCGEQVGAKIEALSRLRRELPPSDTRWVIAFPADQQSRIEQHMESLRGVPPTLAFLDSEALNQLFFLCRDRRLAGVRPDRFIGSFLSGGAGRNEDEW
ncbi:MAG: hypothetical protein M9913_16905 [Bryobacteraceae bacterium]|nr:hypothetical protein [Solibacteraceae bacterium]MCO5352546.1 hypothetical protein [Bryobacteraceae bacterium]